MQQRLKRNNGAGRPTGDWLGHPYPGGHPVLGSPLPMWTSSLLGHPYRCGCPVCWVTLTDVDIHFADPYRCGRPVCWRSSGTWPRGRSAGPAGCRSAAEAPAPETTSTQVRWRTHLVRVKGDGGHTSQGQGVMVDTPVRVKG